MRINLQMIVLFSITVVTDVLGISIFPGILKSLEVPIYTAILFAGCLCMLIFTLKVGSSIPDRKHFLGIIFPTACTFLSVAKLISPLQFSEQQMYDAILVPIRQGGPELPGQSQFPCIHSIPKKLQMRWIEVESTVGIGSNFHATLHRKEFLLK